ncbi:uncharacterized protein [Nicotiana sylvestris]|uniref:uncharacterized protein n=1 Tax=Nicotiana sylvestris TaxID=4096 RepID=UPI00388CB66A
MHKTLAHTGLIPLAAATSQAGGEAQSSATRTPEHRVQVDQIPEVIPVPHVAPVQPEGRAIASEEEQQKLERYKKYVPPTFSGLESEDAQGFVEECHRILHAMGIVESSGVSFNAFQLRGVAYQWWLTYELDSPVDEASLTWTPFSSMFLREYVPQSLRDAWSVEFEQLRQGSMIVSEYAVGFNDLDRHAPVLVSIVRERREAKRSQELSHYSGARAPTVVHHGRGYVSRPIYSALPAASGIPAPPRPHEPYYAPLVSSVPSARGAITGPQAMITAPPATPPTQPARGGGWGGRGCPRGGGQARYYALPARIEVVAFDSIITSIVPVCHRDASVLFDLGFTYSYMSSYFASHLGISQDSLSSPIYVSTFVGHSLVVDHMYRSCLITLSSFETIADLLFISMVDFDVILGMDLLSPHYTIFDCHTKTVMLAMPGLPLLELRST